MWCDPDTIARMAESDGRRTISVRFPGDLFEAIVEAAKEDRRTVSNWIVLAAAEKIERDRQEQEGT